MKKNIIKLSMIAFLLAAFFACGSRGDSPEAVVEKYFKALNDENWSEAKKLSTESTHQFIDFMESISKMAEMAGQKPEKMVGKIENLECQIVEDICNCTMLIDGEFERVKLVRVNCKWLVEQTKEMPGID